MAVGLEDGSGDVSGNSRNCNQDRLLLPEVKVRELSLFGSAVRDVFGPQSDVDVLVSFAPEANWSYWDLVDARSELRGVFGRDVDLIEERSLRNPYRRRAILRDKRVLYAQ